LGIVFSFQTNTGYLSEHCIGQHWDHRFHSRTQPPSPTDIGRLDTEDHHLRQRPAQGVGQRQNFAQASVMEGENIRRLSQTNLVGREADKLTWLPSNVSGVHNDHPSPPLQHLQKVQPPAPTVKHRRFLRQPTTGKLRYHPRTDTVVATQRVSQAQDEN
jgi:hypothetical protein